MLPTRAYVRFFHPARGDKRQPEIRLCSQATLGFNLFTNHPYRYGRYYNFIIIVINVLYFTLLAISGSHLLFSDI